MDPETNEILRKLFDADVHVVAAEPFADVDDLLPEERPAVETAIEKRRREFATGRVLARRLFAEFGAPPAAVPSASDRSPTWPDAFVASITHTADLCAVAMARRGEVTGVGIDVERHRPMKPRMVEMICRPDERTFVDSWPEARRDEIALAIFSAKESAYKCQYPTTQTFLNFHDVEVSLDLERGEFTAHVLRPEAREHGFERIAGRVIVDGDLIAAGATQRTH